LHKRIQFAAQQLWIETLYNPCDPFGDQFFAQGFGMCARLQLLRRRQK